MGSLGYVGLLQGFCKVYRPSMRLGNYPLEDVLDKAWHHKRPRVSVSVWASGSGFAMCSVFSL